MTDKTPNHDLNLYEQGDENWTHTPDMETIEERLIVRDLEENRDNYTPYADALFFARDSQTWYVGDGTSWAYLGTIGSSVETDDIVDKHDHIGAFHSGEYHANDGRWGIHFWAASGLEIHSCVVDINTSSSNLDHITIELWQATEVTVDGNRESESDGSSPVDTTTANDLVDGPQRVALNFTISQDGEYFLTIKPEADADGNYLERRRIPGWNGWDDYVWDNIDLRFGARLDNPTNDDYADYYYYFFDWEIGDATKRVTSPWSHDVEEIYMRPRDPAEEYDDVSPRSLWIDTS